MIVFKVNVLDVLKAKGYTSYKIRQEKVIGQAMLQKLRANQLPSWDVLNTVCRISGLQIGDILEYVPDESSVSEETNT